MITRTRVSDPLQPTQLNSFFFDFNRINLTYLLLLLQVSSFGRGLLKSRMWGSVNLKNEQLKNTPQAPNHINESFIAYLLTRFVIHIMNPALTLLNSHCPPFGFGHQFVTWNLLSHFLWQYHMSIKLYKLHQTVTLNKLT